MEIFNRIKNYLNPINFNLITINTTYHTSLPDELIEQILSMIDGQTRIKILSQVSLQYYHLNRPFVRQCYHLHHYIPQIKKMVHQSGLHLVNFRENVSVYTIDHINDKILELIKPSIDILQLIEYNAKIANLNIHFETIHYHNITQGKQKDFPYRGLKEGLDIMVYFSQLENEKIHYLVNKIRPLLEPIDFILIKDLIFQHEPQFIILLENYFAVYNNTLNDFLHRLSATPDIIDQFMSLSMDINKLIIESKERILLENNFKVLSKDTIVFLNKKQVDTNVPAQYQWVADCIR